MYEAFFGLQKNPFGLTPDASVVFMTRQHREALAGLTYAIVNRKGFAVLTGAVGTGKTTLLSRVLERLPETVRASVILTPTLTPSEFLELAILNFGIKEVPDSKPRRLVLLKEFLESRHRDNLVSVLVADEAHKLSAEVLEEIRLLGNFETSEHKLLQILLVGQNELGELLNRPQMRQLKQRIAVRLSIDAISRAEIEQYISYRWTSAGGTPRCPFSKAAVECIAQASGGVPRLINSLCGSSLTVAFAESSRTVEAAHVIEACADFDLSVGAVPAPSQLEPASLDEYVPATRPMLPLVIRTLERYAPPPKPSMLARWAGRLGLAHSQIGGI